MGSLPTQTYEDILLEKMRPQGVVFLSLIVLEGPHIIKFIAPQEFMDFYLNETLYNEDPTLTVPQDGVGFYKWSNFVKGEEIVEFIKTNFAAIACESLVLSSERKRIILTVGYK
jgi:hypothetical protein